MTKYKILTDSGWQDFKGVRKLPPQSVIKITLENGSYVKCTKDHKIYINCWECVESKTLKIGDNILCKEGYSKIINIEEDSEEDVYDIVDVDNGNKFYANDILVHNCEFIGQSNSLIDANIMRNMLLDLEKETYKYLIDRDVRVYTDINPYKKYVVTLDPSMGVEGDYAAIQVFSFPDFEQVAEWQSDRINQNLQVEKLKNITDWLYSKIKEQGVRHPEVYWSMENNGCGEGFICALREKGGPEYIKRATVVNELGNKRLGFTTSRSTKPAACSQLKILIENNKMKIHSRPYAIQLSNFSAKSATSFAANADGHDDLITSSLIMLMVYIQDKNRLDLTRELYNYSKEEIKDKKHIDELPFIISIG